MGSYTFTWAHPADEVYVTGTFDNWSKSTKLEKVGSEHSKTLDLPSSDDKILYKFVADGDWKHDPTAKTEQDHDGNINNVLLPEDISKSSGLGGAAMSSVAPGSTTTTMAGEQPIEKTTPGAFPETPAANEDQTFSVNPIPASDGPTNPIKLTPGEQIPPTTNEKSITSQVHDDPELKSKDEGSSQTFGVAPIPASGGIGNPIQLAPGEKVPDSSTLSGNTIQNTARTDQASYEKSDAGAAASQPATTTSQERATPAEGVFSAIGGPGPVIPESSMSMGNTTDISKENIGPHMSSAAPGSTTAALAGQQPKEERGVPTVIRDTREDGSSNPTISSAAPGSTTAALAGQQPKEGRGVPTVIKDTREDGSSNPTISSAAPGSTTAALAGQQPLEQRGVPEVVSESQQEAKTAPEAAANPEAVVEKKEVEQELKKEVSEAPSTSESGTLGKSENGLGAKVAAGAAGAGAAAAGAVVAANEVVKEKTGTDVKSNLPQSVQDTVDQKAKDSAIPQKPTDTTTDAARETTTTVPPEVTTSQTSAGEPAEAAASKEAVQEKAQVENELLSKVSESDAKGAPAPTDTAATTTTVPSATGAPQLDDPTLGVGALSLNNKPAGGAGDGGSALQPGTGPAPEPMDSRDVSPMSRPTTQQEQPQVTTGVATSAAPAKNEPAANNTQRRQSVIDKLKSYGSGDSPESASKTTAGKEKEREKEKEASKEKKKENRRSLFGKIKDKLKS